MTLKLKLLIVSELRVNGAKRVQGVFGEKSIVRRMEGGHVMIEEEMRLLLSNECRVVVVKPRAKLTHLQTSLSGNVLGKMCDEASTKETQYGLLVLVMLIMATEEDDGVVDAIRLMEKGEENTLDDENRMEGIPLVGMQIDVGMMSKGDDERIPVDQIMGAIPKVPSHVLKAISSLLLADIHQSFRTKERTNQTTGIV